MATGERGLDHDPYLHSHRLPDLRFPNLHIPDLIGAVEQTAKGGARWTGHQVRHHWKSLAALIVLGGVGGVSAEYFLVRPSAAATTTETNPVATTEPENNPTPVEAAKNDLNIVVLAVPTTEPYIPPTETATATPPPTYTREPSPTPKPTVAPTVTEAPKPTATTTEAPKTEKSPLPIYQPFMGDFFDDKGNKIGMIIVSSIPVETPTKIVTKDKIFVCYITGDKKIGYTIMAFMTETGSIQKDGSFLAFDDSGISRIQVSLDKTGKILTGKVGNGRPGGPTTWKGNFPALNLTGTSGKEAVIYYIRELKMIVTNLTNVSPEQVNIEGIRHMVDYEKWPE